MSRDRSKQASMNVVVVLGLTIHEQELKCVERLHGAREADLARRQRMLMGRFGDQATNQVVGQQMRPYFLSNHRRSLAAQLLHLHRLLERPQVEFRMPAL